MNKSTLLIKQLSQQLAPWHSLPPQSPNWIKNIRKSLGMTTQQLANRLGVNRSRVVKIEHDEQAGALTLQTLRKVAAALECNLVYALVPKNPLPALIDKQAEKVARACMAKVNHSMALENQRTEPEALQAQIEEFKKKLIAGNLKYLWDVE